MERVSENSQRSEPVRGAAQNRCAFAAVGRDFVRAFALASFCSEPHLPVAPWWTWSRRKAKMERR